MASGGIGGGGMDLDNVVSGILLIDDSEERKAEAGTVG